MSYMLLRKTIYQGVNIKENQLFCSKINRLIYQITDGLINYQNTIGDLHIKYYPIKVTKTNTAIFDFLSSKRNTNLLYTKTEKVQNEHHEAIIKKMKKIKWFEKASPMYIELEYQRKHFTLKRIQYVFKDGKKSPQKDEYAEYLNHIERFSSKLFTNISANEQLQIVSAPGSKYYQADALSLLVRYQNNVMGILRFKFLDKSTSYRDQGMLVSFLYALSYTLFNYEHSIASFDLHSFFSNNEIYFLHELFDDFSQIEQITLFREPHIGKVFEKYQYAYGPNYFFTHTIHSKEGIDISKGDILSQSVLIREQKITNYIHNDQDTYNPEICYFNWL